MPLPLFDFRFIGFFSLYLLSLFFSWYVPGSLLTKRVVSKPSIRIALAMTVGLTLFALQGYILGYLQLRSFTYAYLVFTFLWWLSDWRIHLKQLLVGLHGIKNTGYFTLCILFFGSLFQIISISGSGLITSEGARFFFTNAHDGLMHTAFIQSMIPHFPPIQPGALEFPLTNYHYWSDLLLAEMSRIWFIPIVPLFFQYIPLVVAPLTGLIVYGILESWGLHPTNRRLGLFLWYFGGDGAYLITLLFKNSLSTDVAAIDTSINHFLNMPQVFGKLLFFTGLLCFTFWFKTRRNRWLFLSTLIWAVSTGFKVYFGVFSGIGLLSVGLYLLIKTFFSLKVNASFVQAFVLSLRKLRYLLACGVMFCLLFLGIYLPPNSSAGGFFWAPLAWPKLMLSSDNLGLNEWFLRYQVYEAANNIPALTVLEAIAISIFLWSVYGSKVLGFIWLVTRQGEVLNKVKLFVLPGLLIFHILGLTMLQTSGGFNIYNLFVVSNTLLILFVPIIAESFKSRAAHVLFIGIVVTLSLPQSFLMGSKYLKSYETRENSHLVSSAELEALNYLRKSTHPDSLIQTHPQNALDSFSPYTSFFSNRQTFLTGREILKSHNQPISDRERYLLDAFKDGYLDQTATALKAQSIRYLYLRKKKGEENFKGTDSAQASVFFENDEVVIYELL